MLLGVGMMVSGATSDAVGSACYYRLALGENVEMKSASLYSKYSK